MHPDNRPATRVTSENHFAVQRIFCSLKIYLQRACQSSVLVIEIVMDEKPIKINFKKLFIAGKELYNIAQNVINGHLAGDGPFAK